MDKNGQIQTYKDLIVWQRAVDLSIAIYELTDDFPPEERYGLTSQMRRAGVSIASDIAEGRSGGFRKEYRRFLWHAYGSGAELETQIIIAKCFSKTKSKDYSKVDMLLDEVMKMLNVLIHRLRE